MKCPECKSDNLKEHNLSMSKYPEGYMECLSCGAKWDNEGIILSGLSPTLRGEQTLKRNSGGEEDGRG